MKNHASYGIAALYIAVSPLLNRVWEEGGLYGPLAVLIGGGFVLLLAMAMKRWGRSPYFVVLYSLGMLMVLLAVTASTVDRYLYHSSSSLSLTILLALFGGVCLWIREGASQYTAKVFVVGSLVAYLLVLGLGLRHGEGDALWPLESWNTAAFFKLCLSSALGFLPLLLPAFDPEQSPRLIPIGLAVAGVAATSCVSWFVYPPHMLTDEKNMFIEMSKNISFGRFFQRMEFVGSVLFLLLSLLLIMMTACRMAESVGECLTHKGKKRLLTACLYLLGAIPTLLNRNENSLVEFGLCLAMAAAFMAVLFALPGGIGKNRRRAVNAVLALCMLSSCVSYQEIDTFEYPLIVGVETAGDRAHYYFRTDDVTYTSVADSLRDAQESVNLQKPKPIDLSQLGMVLVESDSFDLLQDLLMEIQATDIHNSVLIAVTEDWVSELKEADFSEYQGISEYLNEYKSKLEPYTFLDATAFQACASITKEENCLLPSVQLTDGPMLTNGAVAYGKGQAAQITDVNMKQLLNLKKKHMNILPVEEGVIRVELDGVSDAELSWLNKVYQSTGFDLLGVYSRIARDCFSRETYERYMAGVEKVILTKK